MPNFAKKQSTGNWQLQLDQGVTEFYVAATFAIGPIEWQLEIRPGHH